MTVPDKQKRDDRLDALLIHTESWAKKRRDYLNSQVAFSKRVLRGRAGAQGLNDSTVRAANSLLATELGEFLTGAVEE